jgi:hypothetical protein
MILRATALALVLFVAICAALMYTAPLANLAALLGGASS